MAALVGMGIGIHPVNIWFGVQVNVVVNAWYNPFYDLIQKMLVVAVEMSMSFYAGVHNLFIHRHGGSDLNGFEFIFC